MEPTPVAPRPNGAGAPRPRAVAVLVPSAVLVALLGLLAWSVWPVLRPARAVAVVQAVHVGTSAEAAAAERDGAATTGVPTVQAPGWLEAEPFYTAASALADGVVETIEVLEGDRVERGQVVAHLVPEDAELTLRQREADLGIAEADLAIARADLSAAERSWAEPVELERAVEAARAAEAEREAELEQLPSLIASARATLARLEDESQRVRRSTEAGAANDFELFVAEQHAAAQRADVDALVARTPILEARLARLRADLRAAERDLELRIEDRRRLDTARAGVATAAAWVDRARVQRDEAALELERMAITAPISGFVQRRLKVPGDKVMLNMDSPHSAHVVHLYDPNRLQVRVDVPLADASHVSVGQRCEVVVEVLPDRVFAGEVLIVTHEADLQKNTLQVKVRVIDPDPVLRPEMLTRVKFLPPAGRPGLVASGAGDPGTRVLVPAELLGPGAHRGRLWVVTERRNGRGVLAARPVRVVERDAGWLTVAGDLRPGDLIAVGAPDAREGERVVIKTGPAEEGGAS